MLYFSTNKNSGKVNFREATIRGQAPDRGLYFPEQIPALKDGFISELKNLSKTEIAFEVIRPYVGDTIPEKELRQIVEETVDFDFPLAGITDRIYSLELFHGPTLAFKDVGARFMSRCLGYFVRGQKQKVTVLVATSGDTGGAVASGFYNVAGVDVVILYPSGKVSGVQEQQLTTLGNNITALEIDGSFDDCQQMVKQAFTDSQINEKLFLTSANSINVARWLPQQFYYFFALQQWVHEQPPVISVPSGNFGNICAGLLAFRSGLPVQHFVAGCNANDIVPQYILSGKYEPRKAVHTISNAMDVGDPSNFVRILELFDHQYQPLTKVLSSYSFTDEQTRQTMRTVFKNTGYILDPHGAVGYLALAQYLEDHPQAKGIFLETAHPVKFYDVVEESIGKKLDLPASVQQLSGKKKQSIRMKPEAAMLKSFLMQG
jgi:threonine synthase